MISELFTLAKSIEPVGKARVVAALVQRGEIISFGFNNLKSHPFQAKYATNTDQIYFHAETHAIKNAIKLGNRDIISKCEIIIVRAKMDIKKNWFYAMAKPCDGCMRCIRDFNLKKIIYTNDDGSVSVIEKGN